MGAIRRDVFLELGGFDESRFHYASVEDIELGMRLYAEGRRIVLDPSIQGKHLKRWTFATMTKTDLLRRGAPWLRLMLEQRSSSTVLHLGWANRIGAGTSLLLVVALIRRNVSLAAGALSLLILLDRKFYGLLWRRRGARLAVAAVPLQLVHRLTSIAAVPVALGGHFRERRRPSRF